MSDSPGGRRLRLSVICQIYGREMRDQLRDRRTLFTIMILPLLLYPLIGSVLMQVAQLSNQPRLKIALVGAERLESLPALVTAQDDSPDTAAAAEPLLGEPAGEPEHVQRRGPLAEAAFGQHRFASHLGDDVDSMRLSLFSSNEFGSSERLRQITQRWVKDSVYDVVVLIQPPADLPQRVLTELPAEVGEAAGSLQIRLLSNTASGSSAAAVRAVSSVLAHWRNAWVRESLGQLGIESSVWRPFEVQTTDLASQHVKRMALWSKLLPMVMLIWAMTGAFYPAIDMVAGEKERGTLETLLCSPAARGEIVWGKLAAVTSFSLMTAILNTISMLVTGGMVASQIGLGAPTAMPTSIVIGMLIVLMPLSVMFSAIALGLSAIARSSKEGQYYLMPMMMAIIPLVVLPTFPGVQLSVGTSLIPVSGVFLLVRAWVEGQYATALWHFPIIAAVTTACVGMAVHVTHRLFENENVLFHGGQMFSIRRMWRSIRDHRQPLATAGQAYGLAALILVLLFFGRLLFTSPPGGAASLAAMVLLPQLGLILLPTLVVAAIGSRRLRSALRLHWPGGNIVLFAAVLGVTLHPTYLLLSQWVTEIYPVSEAAQQAMVGLTDQISGLPWLAVVLLMAVTPAICEELAFRGYVLGGLLRDGQPMRAVLITAVVFGVSHGVLQQSICATLMGVLLGWMAWKTGSVIPTILTHLINNSLSVSLGQLAAAPWAGKELVLNTSAEEFGYQPLWTLICMTFSLAILLIIGSLPGDRNQSAAGDVGADAGAEGSGDSLQPLSSLQG